MKSLKFFGSLPKLILDRQKNTTWRIADEKNIAIGDIIALCYPDGKEFAQAQVTEVKETTFSQLNAQDKVGHEEFSSDQEMYRTYSAYYKIKVTPQTRVKIIKFKLIK